MRSSGGGKTARQACERHGGPGWMMRTMQPTKDTRASTDRLRHQSPFRLNGARCEARLCHRPQPRACLMSPLALPLIRAIPSGPIDSPRCRSRDRLRHLDLRRGRRPRDEPKGRARAHHILAHLPVSHRSACGQPADRCRRYTSGSRRTMPDRRWPIRPHFPHVISRKNP